MKCCRTSPPLPNPPSPAEALDLAYREVTDRSSNVQFGEMRGRARGCRADTEAQLWYGNPIVQAMLEAGVVLPGWRSPATPERDQGMRVGATPPSTRRAAPVVADACSEAT